ncbi:hypothetical protein B0H14DRAFT_3508647 [Mycena olivaceomarginata]|nr:hypothetical protein B0H14DRAFT_3508647 [Mycena olivaceomarginata]
MPPLASAPGPTRKTLVRVVTPITRTAFIAHPPAAPVSVPLRRSPRAARVDPIKPLLPHGLTPSAGSLARLPAGASEHPQPLHPSSQPPLFPCPQPLARLPPTPTIISRRCYTIGAPHACVCMHLLSFCVHTPLRYDRAYHLPLPSTLFLWFPYPAPPRCQDYNSTAVAILSYLAILLLAARVANSLPPLPPPDPSHLGFQVCRLTLGLMGLDELGKSSLLRGLNP